MCSAPCAIARALRRPAANRATSSRRAAATRAASASDPRRDGEVSSDASRYESASRATFSAAALERHVPGAATLSDRLLQAEDALETGDESGPSDLRFRSGLRAAARPPRQFRDGCGKAGPRCVTGRIRLTSRTDSAAWEYVDAVRVVGCAGEALGAACRRPNHLVELSPNSRFSELLRRLRLRGGRREWRGAYGSTRLRRSFRRRRAALLRHRSLELR